MRDQAGTLVRRWVLCCTAALLASASAVPSVAAADKPNVLFILTDDQGRASLGCYGNKLVPTPHLDRLAADGLRFNSAYVMPQCTPTRAALFTGRHSARTGMWHVLTNPWYGYPWAPVREPAYRESLPRDWFMLPKGLRAAGYATGMAGKWHLTMNADGDYSALNAPAASAYGFDFVAPRGAGTPNEGDKWVDHLTDSAIEFIRRNRERPWFFYLAHHTLHGTVSAPADLVTKYRAQGAPATGLNNATYLAAIEHLDDSVGRLLTTLDELKLSERTLVVFLADNGGVSRSYDPKPFTDGPGTDTQLRVAVEEFGNGPLRGPKGSPYEGGIRVPCLVRWPNVVAAGRVEETPIHAVDWLPTLLEAAQTNVPNTDHPDGVSLMPLFRGKQLPSRSLYWYMPLYDLRWGATPCAVVRRDDWKLIEYFGDRYDANGKYLPGRHLELYNLRNDLGETTNLADRDPARRQALLDDLHRMLRDCQAEIPGPNKHHDPTKAFKETKTKPDFLK